MGSFYSFLREHKLKVLASIGIATLAGGIVYKSGVVSWIRGPTYEPPQHRKFDANFYTRKSVQALDEHEITLYSAMTKAGKLEALVEATRVNYIPHSQILEPSTIIEILHNTMELAVDEYVSATLKNRKARRKQRRETNWKAYKATIIRYYEEIEEIIERAQAELLNRLDIPKEVFEDSMLTLMERGYFQQLYMLQSSIKQKIKEKIPSTKDLSVNKMKDIIKVNIQLLREQPHPMQSIITQMSSIAEQKDMIPNAINLMVNDALYNKFGVEEEDQIKNLQKPEIMADSEIHQLLGQIEQAMTDLMALLGLGGIDQLPDSLDQFT